MTRAVSPAGAAVDADSRTHGSIAALRPGGYLTGKKGVPRRILFSMCWIIGVAFTR